MPEQDTVVLYRYKSLDGDGVEHVEDMLSNSRIWFSSPTEFSDPFDCRRAYEKEDRREQVVLRKAMFLCSRGLRVREAVAQAEDEIPIPGQALDGWFRSQHDYLARCIANSAVLCMTTVCDHPLMWAHYAAGHRGVCIQFEATEESHVDFIGSALQVEYVDRLPVVSTVHDSREEVVRKIFFAKSTHFRYEKEWRIVRYNDGPGLKPLPSGVVAAILLGCRICPKHKDRIIEAASNYNTHVRIMHAELDPERFGLRFV